jgi:hypothetical protein
VPKPGVALGGLGEGQLGGGGLEVVAQEGGVVAVARGVDADADAGRRLGAVSWCGRMVPPEKGLKKGS